MSAAEGGADSAGAGPVATPVQTMAVDLLVVGGGIAGLTAAYIGHQQGLSVLVCESARQVGGKVRSERRGDYLIECGPNSFLGSAKTIWRLISQLNLEDQVVAGQPPGDRFIYRNRQARRLPKGLADLFRGDFMTLAGKLRLMAEPFQRGRAQVDDTVLAFARRRLGPEAAQYLVSPFVSGIYAGDPAALGARDSFPSLWNWEAKAGSIILGALAGAFSRKPKDLEPPVPKRRGMFSFQQGFGALPKAMAQALPPGSARTHTSISALRLTQPEDLAITGISPQATPEHRYFAHGHVAAEPGHAPGDSGVQLQVFAKQVVLALPPKGAATLLHALLPQAADRLQQVELCRVAVVHWGGPDPEHVAPQGFGLLVPPGEGLRTLGILMPSSVFAGRAPQGAFLHSAFLGGARDPDAVDLGDETLQQLAERAEQNAFGPLRQDRPLSRDFQTVVRWREAIPQYKVGHRQAMREVLDQVHAQLPGLTLAGNYLNGISVNDAAQSGWDAISYLRRQGALVAGPGGQP